MGTGHGGIGKDMFPTDIKDAERYLMENFVDVAEAGGTDLATLRKRLKGVRHELRRLAHNEYQDQLIQGAVSAIVSYMKQGRFGDQAQRKIVLAALVRLRNAPAFGPRS